MIPGEVIAADGEIELNAGRETVTLSVANTGDRPIQVGSHYHFYETNEALAFDRAAARGHHKAVERREPHRRRNALALAQGRQAGAAAEMGNDERTFPIGFTQISGAPKRRGTHVKGMAKA